MALPRAPLAACALAGALFAARAATACEGAHLGEAAADAPEVWRSALLALVASTEVPGPPWSCVPATVWVELHGTATTLVVQPRDGAPVRRAVESPEEVLPLGQALLAVPLEPTQPISQAPPPPPPESPPTAPLPAAESPPRVRVAALVTPRHAGKTDLFWLGAQVDAAIPFGAWSVGGWGRFDAIRLGHTDPSADLDEACLGLAAGRDVGLGGPVLRGSVRPSLALVWGSGGRSADSPTRVFGRVGAELRLLLPFTRELRGVVALDGELAPSLLGEPSSRGGNNGDATSTDTRPEPTYPAYTVGLGLGVELAIR